MVVIEDGHWADTPTLLLLRHLARGAAEARALVVTTFRDTEAEVPEALSAALVDLRRSEGVVRLRLAGLSAEEIGEFVARAVGDELGSRICPRSPGSCSELTGGNAFLITELWRTLLESDAMAVYDGGPRLAERPGRARKPGGRARGRQPAAGTARAPATSRLLELAAVAGPEFDLSAITRSGLADEELAAALEQAIAHGMIEEVPSPQIAFRFTHELVRRALYDRMARPATSRAAPPGRRSPRGAPARWRAAGAWPSSPTTSAPRHRWTDRSARSNTRCWRAARR